MSNDVAVSSSAVPAIPESYLVRLREMLKAGSRKIIGLVGPPGAGKTAAGQALAALDERRVQGKVLLRLA